MSKYLSIILIIALTVSITFAHESINDNEKESILQAEEEWGPLLGAFLANIFSEFGDKTFIIAAILAMKYSRLTVFIGAAGALIFMTLLACICGHYLPSLLSPHVTSLLAGVLLTLFGLKMLYEAYQDEDDSEEEKEIERELMEMDRKMSTSSKKSDDSKESPSKKRKREDFNTVKDKPPFFSKKNLYILFGSFGQVFFGEWGDRSQLTTLILASDNNSFLVFIGASAGQSLCTVVAVIGGRYLSKMVSERTLNIGGGILMLVFALHSYYKAFSSDE